MGLEIGSKLDLTIKNNEIILSPVQDEITLESLLHGTEKNDYALSDEDKKWLDMKPIGLEFGAE